MEKRSWICPASNISYIYIYIYHIYIYHIYILIYIHIIYTLYKSFNQCSNPVALHLDQSRVSFQSLLPVWEEKLSRIQSLVQKRAVGASALPTERIGRTPQSDWNQSNQLPQSHWFCIGFHIGLASRGPKLREVQWFQRFIEARAPKMSLI